MQTKQVKVFIIDSKRKPCLPTTSARARRLLKQGKAKVSQVIPFTIQLTYEIESPIGNFEMGVDDGAKYVGIAVKDVKTNEIVFHAQLNHRQDVSRKVEERKNYRKARRFRLRNRQPRFDNRIGNKLAPSIRQRKDAILRTIKDLSKRLNIVKVKVEEVAFNHAKYRYGRSFSLVEVGKKYLREELQRLGLIYEATFGYITKKSRIRLGLSKRHSHDACAIIGCNNLVGREYYIKPKRTKTWESNPTKIYDVKKGFRHYDLVKAEHRTKGIVIGSIRSLKAKMITLRTAFDDNFPVSYSKTKLLQRFRGLIYLPI